MGKKILRHHDLEMYQKAFGAAMEIYEFSKAFPREEIYSLTDQIRKSARSVCANLAEAWRKRRYEAAFVAKITDAEAEAAETQTWIEFAVRSEYMPREDGAELYQAYHDILGTFVGMVDNPGNLELYIMSPPPMMAVLTGMALGGMTTTLVRATAVTVTGVLLFDVPLQPTNWWSLVAVFLLTLAALYGLGMMFASLFLLWGREAWHLVNLLQEPVYLLSGTNFPLTVFKAWLPTAVVGAFLLVPLAAGMDAMRQVLFRAEGLIDVEWE